jgi:hypothetical protein
MTEPELSAHQPNNSSSSPGLFTKHRFSRTLGIVLWGIAAVMICFELVIRAAWTFFGLVPSSNHIDPYCLPTTEVLLRAGTDFRGFYQFDRIIGRRWIPNNQGLELGLQENGDNGDYIVISTNENGWRDVSHSLAKPPNVYRIVLVGDSFAEPWRRPMDQGIAHQLQNWLNQQGLNQQVEVVNLSMSGSNPVDYSLIIKYEAPRYAPDLILVLLFPSNDVIDGQIVDLLSQTREVDGRIVYKQEWLEYVEQEFVDRSKSPAEDGSLSWDELDAARRDGRLITKYQHEDGLAIFAVQLEQPRSDVPPGMELHCLMQRISRGYTWIKDRIRIMKDAAAAQSRMERRTLIFQSPPSPLMEQGWSQYERLLSQLADDAAAQQTRIVFVTLPSGQEVYPEIFDHEVASAGSSSQEYDSQYPTRRTADYCRQQGLLCWFLLPALQQASSTQQLFDYFDPADPQRKMASPGHYTPFGYALAAQTIGQSIIEANWIGTDVTGP